MSTLVVHPGTQHAPRLARELAARGMLGGYWTGLALSDASALAGIAKRLRRFGAFRALSNRIVAGVPGDKLHCKPLIELKALLSLRRGEDELRVLHERNQAFQASVPDACIRASRAIIGFDTSSALVAERAKILGVSFYLDRTIAHPAALPPLLVQLAKQYPEWAPRETRRPAYLIDAENREHARARKIVVGGTFARATLIESGISPERVVVNPYGADWESFVTHGNKPCEPHPSRPLRFLYVGSVIARKGVPVLLDAWRRLAPKEAELWIAGVVGPHERGLMPSMQGLRVLGQVAKADIPALYASADVFVLPSLFEGFGLVILEALAAGLPVISTPHTGAVEAVTSPALGRLVPVLDAEALSEAMRAYIANPPLRAEVRAAALAIRAQFTWDAYGDRWAKLLAETS